MILKSMSKDRFAQVAGEIMAAMLSPSGEERGFPDPNHCGQEVASRAVEFATALDQAMIDIYERTPSLKPRTW